MSTKHIEALKLALEGAANYIDALGGDSRKYRQALAEKPAQQEHVGLIDGEGNTLTLMQAVDHAIKSTEKIGAHRLNKILIAARKALAEQPAQQEPVAWKLVPKEPTHEMLKAMDECSTEGYDERLYAGHAASIYMAAVDAAPTPPAQRKPLTDEEIILIVAECAASHQHTDIHFARAIERAHGIKELV